MEEKEIVKEYSNGELTVVWKPGKCIHSAICVNTLPEVYNPKDKPWIKPNNATTKDLKDQISKCPSGALSYYMNNENEEKIDLGSGNRPTKIQAVLNGPLLVQGSLSITLPDGRSEEKEGTTAFCRCGASANKPFCDGTHVKIDFKD